MSGMDSHSFEHAVRADLRRWGVDAADDPEMPLATLTSLWREHYALRTVKAA